MGQLDGKVAFISGIARGQGRSHALTLAGEGADIIGFDLCRKPDSTPYPGSTPEDLEDTRNLIEKTGRQVVADIADVRDYHAVKRIFDDGIATFGRVDCVVANAGICAGGLTWEITEPAWREMLDINLTGVWNTVRAAIPTLIEQGDGGAIVMTGSADGIKGAPHISSYTASKFGVNGLVQSLACELGQYNIRVNSVNPGQVDTNMIGNEFVWGLFRPDLEHPTREDVTETFRNVNVLPIPWMEPQDVSNAVLHLVSDASRYMTAHAYVVDAGILVKP